LLNITRYINFGDKKTQAFAWVIEFFNYYLTTGKSGFTTPLLDAPEAVFARAASS
jgi:hypothetical protein